MSYKARAYYSPDGVTTIFAIPCPYILIADIHVYLNGVEQSYSLASPTTIQLVTAPVTGLNTVEVRRITPSATMRHNIQTGTISPEDINDNDLQLLYLTQELYDQELYDVTNAASTLNQAIVLYQNALGLVSSVTGAALYYAPVGSIVNAPSGAEVSGDRYIVGTSPTGAFAGKANYIAELQGTTWVFAPPKDGLQIQIKGQGYGYSYINNVWRNGFVFNWDTVNLNDSLNPLVDFTMTGGSDAFCITSIDNSSGGAFHLHKARGSLSSPTKPLNGDYLMSCGIRGLSGSTGKFSGSSAAILCNLTEDSNFTYSKCVWSFEGTRTVAGVREPWHTMREGLHGFGKDAATPGFLGTFHFDQNGSTAVCVQNYSSGTGAQTQVRVDNGINGGQLIQFGSSFTTSGLSRQGGTMLYADGPGGLTFATGANQPIYFVVNNTPVWNISTSGQFLPNANNSWDIGSAGVAVKNIYSVNTLNVTSDESTKTDIRDLTEAEIATGDAIKWQIFKHIGGDRLHAGVVAQQVEEAFTANGLDPYTYGVLGFDLLTETKLEEYEDWVEQPKTRVVERQEHTVEIVDGMAIRTVTTRQETEEVTEAYPLYDGATGEALATATGEPLYHQVTVMERVFKKLTREVTTPVMVDGVQQKRRFVRYAELTAFALAAHEARLDKLEDAANV